MINALTRNVENRSITSLQSLESIIVFPFLIKALKNVPKRFDFTNSQEKSGKKGGKHIMYTSFLFLFCQPGRSITDIQKAQQLIMNKGYQQPVNYTCKQQLKSMRATFKTALILLIIGAVMVQSAYIKNLRNLQGPPSGQFGGGQMGPPPHSSNATAPSGPPLNGTNSAFPGNGTAPGFPRNDNLTAPPPHNKTAPDNATAPPPQSGPFDLNGTFPQPPPDNSTSSTNGTRPPPPPQDGTNTTSQSPPPQGGNGNFTLASNSSGNSGSSFPSNGGIVIISSSNSTPTHSNRRGRLNT